MHFAREQGTPACDASAGARDAHPEGPLDWLLVHGTDAARLRRIIVRDIDRIVFELDTLVDPWGRESTAGEILAAISSYGDRPGLVIELHSEGIVVPAATARIELCVSSDPQAHAPRVRIGGKIR